MAEASSNDNGTVIEWGKKIGELAAVSALAWRLYMLCICQSGCLLQSAELNCKLVRVFCIKPI